jgi:uncharacterized protein YjbI with pentapeptide repeats
MNLYLAVEGNPKIKVLVDSELVHALFFGCDSNVQLAETLLKLIESRQVDAYVTETCISKLIERVSFLEKKSDLSDFERKVFKMFDNNIIELNQEIYYRASILMKDAYHEDLKTLEAAIELACIQSFPNIGAIVCKSLSKYKDLISSNISVLTISELYSRICLDRRLCVNNSIFKLSGAYLRGVNLVGANLRGIQMIYSDLRTSDLSHSFLSYSKLKGSNISRANLISSTLMHSILWDVNFDRSNLSKSNLSCADFSGACLIRSNLALTNLRGAIFNHANLEGADLRGTNLTGTEFNNANLRNTIFDKNPGFGENIKNNFIDRGAKFL